MPITVLVVEDSTTARAIIRAAIESVKLLIRGRGSIQLKFASTLRDGLNALPVADVLLLDLELPDSPAEATLSRVAELSKVCQTILYTSHDVPSEIRGRVFAVVEKNGSFDRIAFAKVVHAAVTTTLCYEADSAILQHAQMPARTKECGDV